LGYSINDSLRFRELIAANKGVKTSQVQATVVGEHGSTQVPLFSSARIDGKAVSFTEDEKKRILDEIPNILRRYEELQSGRTAGWTCAVGMAKLIKAIREDSGEVFPCSIVLDGEFGQRNVSMSVPVKLGRTGAREIQEWTLAADEQPKFEKSAAAMSAAARIVDDVLQKIAE
jgi:malate dehydrogenase